MTSSAAPPAVIDRTSPAKSGRAIIRSDVHWISLHGVTAEVVAPRSLNRTLAIVLGGYTVAEPCAAPDIRVTIEPGDSERFPWQVSDGNHTYPESDRNGMPAIRAEWLVISQAIKLLPDFVHVHAGLIATDDQSVLLIGRSGSGKSTTTAALALAGLDVYTDDVALIDRASLRALCVPRPIKLDRVARAHLRRHGLVIPPRRRLNESVDRTILPGLPPADSLGPPLGAALFFARTRADQPSLRLISSAEAALRLVQQSASERFNDSELSTGALAIVNSVPCYELTTGDLDATVRLIQCHLGHVAIPGPIG